VEFQALILGLYVPAAPKKSLQFSVFWPDVGKQAPEHPLPLHSFSELEMTLLAEHVHSSPQVTFSHK
jgi:hypothetical protein